MTNDTMINVNATIIIQACNFFIAYILLRRFLFKPAISILNEENKQKNALISIINQQQQSIEIREKERQKHWYECREYFKEQQPPIDTPELYIFKKLTPEMFSRHISEQRLNELVTDVYQALDKKIKHVH